MRGFVAALIVLSASMSIPIRVRADEKKACVAAYKEAQVRRKAGALRDAREQLLVCSRSTCPSVIRADCGPWLGEVSRAIASVVLSATDDGGVVLEDVAVQMDGQPLAPRLDGRPLEVDPGSHTFAFSLGGSAPVERRVDLAAGERAHRIQVVFRRPRTAIALPADGDAHAPHPVPLSTLSLGGVGVLGGVGFVVFGLLGNGQKSDLDSSKCSPNCPGSQVATAERDYVVADVSLAVGVVSLALATYFYVTRPARARDVVGLSLAPLREGQLMAPILSW